MYIFYRLHRKFSLPPPLDLPIKVPPFSNLREMTGKSSDVNTNLERFKATIERRLVKNNYHNHIFKNSKEFDFTVFKSGHIIFTRTVCCIG